jgi:hypothetical protein
MTEVDKPLVLAPRGGAWFRAGGVELHLGAEDYFRPAVKGHPGILVDDLDDVVRPGPLLVGVTGQESQPPPCERLAGGTGRRKMLST